MSIFTNWKNKILVRKRKRRMQRQNEKFPLVRRLYGVKNSQGALVQSRAGDDLQIVHAPLPNYPKNVFVYSIPLNLVLGYLDESTSEKLLFSLGANFCVDGEIESVYQEEPFTCILRIFPTSERMKGVEDFTHLYGE